LKGPVKAEGAEERGLLQACRSPSALEPGSVETASLPRLAPAAGCLLDTRGRACSR